MQLLKVLVKSKKKIKLHFQVDCDMQMWQF